MDLGTRSGLDGHAWSAAKPALKLEESARAEFTQETGTPRAVPGFSVGDLVNAMNETGASDSDTAFESFLTIHKA